MNFFLPLDWCSFCLWESASCFKIEAVLTIVESDLLRRFRVWSSGLGVPIWLTGFRQASDGRIHHVTSSRKKPNVGAALYCACAPTFGFFRKIATRWMRPSEASRKTVNQNRNAQSRSPYPEAAEKSALYNGKYSFDFKTTSRFP